MFSERGTVFRKKESNVKMRREYAEEREHVGKDRNTAQN
jgi:hypothetical protein